MQSKCVHSRMSLNSSLEPGGSPQSEDQPVLSGPLRSAASIAVPLGAVGSVGLMLWAGRRNDSRILLVLFGLWVLSPFVLLALVKVVSRRWSFAGRAVLHSL